mmetsp:Transcript_155785/g.283340  ORF Transcript_155785/g.283340 Transcript_155785/m.283340 type:complete len:382 (+) Transcript_155785:86-1231(+)
MEHDYDSAQSTQGAASETDCWQDGSKQDCVGKVNEKHLVIDTSAIDERQAAAEINGRIDAVETSMRDFGKHFIQYQQNVLQILGQECQRLDQQMRDQRAQLQGRAQKLVAEAMSSAREDMIREINASFSSTLNSGKCKEEMSTRETASTASEDSEVHGELTRLINEARKDIASMSSDFKVHTSATEKRLASLETDIKAQQNKVKDHSHVGSDELGLPEEKNPSLVRLSQESRLQLEKLTEAAEKLKFPEVSPRPKLREKIAELDEVLRSCTNLIHKAPPACQRSGISPGTPVVSWPTTPDNMTPPVCWSGSPLRIGTPERSGRPQGIRVRASQLHTDLHVDHARGLKIRASSDKSLHPTLPTAQVRPPPGTDVRVSLQQSC